MRKLSELIRLVLADNKDSPLYFCSCARDSFNRGLITQDECSDVIKLSDSLISQVLSIAGIEYDDSLPYTLGIALDYSGVFAPESLRYDSFIESNPRNCRLAFSELIYNAIADKLESEGK